MTGATPIQYGDPVEAAFGTPNRVCESCGGAMPARMSRQRDADGRLVCDNCKSAPPRWKSAHASTMLLTDPESRAEFYRREVEAVSSIMRVSRVKQAVEDYAMDLTVNAQTGDLISVGSLISVAHDMGDGGVVNHCPFCGSGAVVGGSDGSVECGFCHTVFSVQVQPNNPSMPQTVNGQPFVPPGMPSGEPTEMSEPKDPVAEQQDQQDGEDPSGAQQPGHPSSGDPNPSSADMVSDRQANPPHEKAKQDAADPTQDDGSNPFAKGDSGADKPGDKKSDNPFAKKDDSAGQSPHKDPSKGDSHPDNDKANSGAQPVDPRTLKKVDDTEEEVDPDDLVLVKKKKAAGLFQTPDGPLDGEAYMKRLALQFADDRSTVLTQIQTERA